MSLQIVAPFHSISLTIIVIMIWYENGQIHHHHHQHYHKWTQHKYIHTRLHGIDCYWLWLGRFFAWALRHTTYIDARTQKRRKISHAYIIYFVAAPKTHNPTPKWKSAENVSDGIHMGWIGLVYVVVMLDHKYRFCCLCPKRDIFRAFVFTKGFSFCRWLPIAGQVHQPSIVQAIQPVWLGAFM